MLSEQRLFFTFIYVTYRLCVDLACDISARLFNCVTNQLVDNNGAPLGGYRRLLQKQREFRGLSTSLLVPISEVSGRRALNPLKLV